MSPRLEEQFDLERVFNFRLWKLATLASAPVIRLCEGRYGVSRREWRLLALLSRHGEMAPSDLSEHIGVDRARASRAISSLADKGLVERRALPGDRRQARVGLTAAGKRLADEIHPQIAEINNRVLAALSPELHERFDEALALLTERAAEVNRELVPDVRANRHLGSGERPRPGRDGS